MSIRSLTRRTTWIAVAIAGLLAAPAWLAATQPPPEGPSFTSLQDPFTQALYATSATVASDEFDNPNILGGVAFAPDGRVWSAECTFLGTRMHLFKAGTTSIHDSDVHEEEKVVDLTVNGPWGYDAAGCGLVNHPDGAIYSNSTAGIWKLNAYTGEVAAGPFGHGGNSLGIAVDPQTSHIVYVGDDCHPSLFETAADTCTVWDLDPVSHESKVFARFSRSYLMLFDGIYFDPTGEFLFAAHRETLIDEISGLLMKRNGLRIIKRPDELRDALDVNGDPVAADETQALPLVQMASEPDGVAFHATNGFVVTLNESTDCVNASGQLVERDPNTGNCVTDTTTAGGSMTRFDFANGYDQPPSLVTTFALGGFRGDLLQVGPDGCIYGTQAPLFATEGTVGTRYQDLTETGDQSIFQICGGFAPPPGISTTGTVAGTVFSDCSGNGVQDDGDLGAAGISVTLTGPDGTHTATTDSTGAYTFPGLQPGQYSVNVTAPAGMLVTQPPPVTLSTNETMSAAPVALIPLSTVSGIVTTTSNQLVSGVQVTVSGTSNQNQTVTTHALTTPGGTFSVTVPPGTYSVTVPPTYNGLTLQSSPATVTTQCGETPPGVTITYEKLGTVRIEKVSVGGVGAFSFSGNLPGGPTSLTTLAEGVAATAMLSDVATGVYAVTESVPAGWTLTSVSCNGGGGNTSGSVGTATATIGVDPGEDIVCTFTNTKQASVQIRKVSLGGVGTFNFTNGVPGGPTSLTTTTAGTAASGPVSTVAPGTYTVTETGMPSGWNFTSLACTGDGGNTTTSGQTATIVVDPGEAIVCTFTNTKLGSVTIQKVSLGGTGTFNFTSSAGPFSLTTAAAGTAVGVTSSNVPTGSYTVAESSLPSGWNFTSLVCNGGGSNTSISGATATIGVDPGENIVCTFTNSKQASVRIEKVSIGGVGAFSFTDTVPGGPTSITTSAAGTAAGTTVSNVAPGSYTVTETGMPSGWSFTSVSCSGGGSNTTTSGQTATIGVDPGETIVCTFTNSTNTSQGPCVAPAYTFAFSGSSASSGTAGNIRTFTLSGGASVKASAFSRIDSSGSWSSAYLGLYSAGLGVTDGSEGDGSNDRHKVDNIGGRNNYVLFEFNQVVTINRAFLDYIGADSDISVWIGTKTNPYSSHNTLSDAFLTGLGQREDNTTALTATSRWADINAKGISGNVLVISALVNDDTPEDEFKISKLETGCPTPITSCVGSGGDFSFVGNTASSGTAGNIRTFTLNGISVKASGFSRTDTGSWATGYLGLYGSGMGVTDTSEGDGSNNRHKVDNIGGRNNYVLFEFSTNVIIDKAFLDAIGTDSDFAVWIGSKNDPFNNHQTLSDSFLSGLGYTEDNLTSATVTSRWGDVNGGRRMGNILVVAALPSDTSPEDEFKISKLTYVCQ